jgi:probable metal-binding protein
MLTLDRSFTRESLRKSILEKFGAEARFFTCSAQNMTMDELIDFLQSRGKFVEAGDGVSTSPDKICNH